LCGHHALLGLILRLVSRHGSQDCWAGCGHGGTDGGIFWNFREIFISFFLEKLQEFFNLFISYKIKENNEKF
jgi:hypothetical protein